MSHREVVGGGSTRAVTGTRAAIGGGAAVPVTHAGAISSPVELFRRSGSGRAAVDSRGVERLTFKGARASRKFSTAPLEYEERPHARYKINLIGTAVRGFRTAPLALIMIPNPGQQQRRAANSPRRCQGLPLQGFDRATALAMSHGAGGVRLPLYSTRLRTEASRRRHAH